MSNLFTSSFKSRVKNAALFLFCALLLLIMACALQLAVLKKTFEGQRLFFGQEKKILFLGDSHCKMSFNPAGHSSWVNTGQLGENILCSYYKLKALLAANPQVDQVVFSCSPHNISSNAERNFFGEAAGVQYNRYYYLFDMEGDRYAMGNAKERLRAFAIYRLGVPLEWDRLTLRYLPRNKSLPFIGDGYSNGYDEITQGDFISYAIEQHYYDNGAVAEISDHQLNSVKKICELTADLDIKLLVVSTPVMSEYAKLTPAVYDEVFSKAMNNLTNNFSNVEYVDFRAFFSEEANYFYDGHHLNSTGANIISDAIERLL